MKNKHNILEAEQRKKDIYELCQKAIALCKKRDWNKYELCVKLSLTPRQSKEFIPYFTQGFPQIIRMEDNVIRYLH